jgi:hypothetical protein
VLSSGQQQGVEEEFLLPDQPPRWTVETRLQLSLNTNLTEQVLQLQQLLLQSMAELEELSLMTLYLQWR